MGGQRPGPTRGQKPSDNSPVHSIMRSRVGKPLGRGQEVKMGGGAAMGGEDEAVNNYR